MAITEFLEAGENGFAAGKPVLPPAFLARIAKAYQRGMETFVSPDSALWTMIVGRSRAVHDAAMAGDLATLGSLVANPGDHFLFFGFDNLYKDDVDSLRVNQAICDGRAAQLGDLLRKLAVAMGVLRSPNHEFPPGQEGDKPQVLETLLSGIEKASGGRLDFPNPFPREHGLLTSRGVISHRAVHAVYQAWRVKTLASHFGPRVLEIGAGLGRTAYHAIRFGVPAYTIIDLPMTNLSQGVFLGHALGESQVALTGEAPSNAPASVVTPDHFLKPGSRPRYNVVLNVDSLTEINEAVATQYAQRISEEADVFLSINHEANAYTVGRLPALGGRCIARSPYPLRQGYIEELFIFKR